MNYDQLEASWISSFLIQLAYPLDTANVLVGKVNIQKGRSTQDADFLDLFLILKRWYSTQTRSWGNLPKVWISSCFAKYVS
jgi:intergrase/recombinase